MTFCPAAITTAALFTAIVLIDLAKGKYRHVPFHALGGFFCTLGLNFICQSMGDTTAWILLSIPLIFILLGLFLIWWSGPTTVAAATAQQADSCQDMEPACQQMPPAYQQMPPAYQQMPPAYTPTAPPPTLPASVTSVPPATSISTIGCRKTT